MSSTRLYNIWGNMKSRCHNENDTAFKNYGKLGVDVCDNWKLSFIKFYNWAINNGYKKHLSIDRINPYGNYEPDNCRWATDETQARNKRKLDSNTSGFIGVSQDKRYKASYRAYININHKHIHLGTFKNALDAAKHRDEYIIKNNLEHSRNFK